MSISTEAYNYIFNASGIYNEFIFEGLKSSLVAFILNFANVVVSISTFLLFIGIIVAKIFLLGLPYLKLFGAAVFDFHVNQLSVYDILIELSIILTLVLYILYRKRLHASWRKLENYVACRSKVAAKIAPHFLFFLFATILSVVGRNIIFPLATPGGLALITLVLPLFKTIRILYISNNLEFSSQLKVWVVLAVYHVAAETLRYIPYSTAVLGRLVVARAFVAIVTVWAQAFPFCANVVFESSAPVLERYTRLLPTLDVDAKDGMTNKLLMAFTAMRFIGIISAAQQEYLVSLSKGLLREGVTTVVAFVLCCTPYPIAFIGVMFVGFIFPAQKTMTWLLSHQHRLTHEQKTVHMLLLDYWCCLATVWLMRCGGLVMWPSVTMLVLLWLQSSYLRGATLVRMYVTARVKALLDRHKRVAKEIEERIEKRTMLKKNEEIDQLIVPAQNSETSVPDSSCQEDVSLLTSTDCQINSSSVGANENCDDSTSTELTSDGPSAHNKNANQEVIGPFSDTPNIAPPQAPLYNSNAMVAVKETDAEIRDKTSGVNDGEMEVEGEGDDYVCVNAAAGESAPVAALNEPRPSWSLSAYMIGRRVSS